MNLKQLKNKLLQNPEVKSEFEKYDLAFVISERIIDARVKAKMTQQELAKKVNTKQSGIARAENGTRLPSLSFLQKIAIALDTSIDELIKPTNTINSFETNTISESQYSIQLKPNYFDNFLIKTDNQNQTTLSDKQHILFFK
jgi:transcriptional regulator with XRE-family HTH domain